MGDSPSDAELIRASLTDPDRFAEVFNRHYETIRRFAQRRLGMDVGEELAAQTFESAFRSRGRFDDRYRSARPWLFGIATNLINNERRAERTRLRALGRTPVEPHVSASPFDAVDARFDASRLAGPLGLALAELDPRERDVVLLMAWGELDYAEIGIALGIPIGTFRSRMHRARRRLRELVPALVPIEEWDDDA